MNNKLGIMEEKIEKIQVEHIDLGVITINSEISDYANSLIGEKANDFCKWCHYYGEININENGAITVKNLHKVSAESVNVGIFNDSGIIKNFIKVYKNKLINDNVIFYEKSILSIIS